VESKWVHSACRPLNGLLYLPRVIMMMENLVEWRLAEESEVLGENLPLCPPQIPLDQTQAQTQAATVGSQWLTAWAMARPKLHFMAVPLVATKCSESVNALQISLILFILLVYQMLLILVYPLGCGWMSHFSFYTFKVFVTHEFIFFFSLKNYNIVCP
jgi:hypothetical protein